MTLTNLIKASILAAVLVFQAAIAETININTANAETLQYIDGIGEKRAQAIVDYRKKYGNFKNLDDLTNVEGIGQKTLASVAKAASTTKGIGILTDAMKSKTSKAKANVTAKTSAAKNKVSAKKSAVKSKADKKIADLTGKTKSSTKKAKTKTSETVKKAKSKAKTTKKKATKKAEKIKAL